MSDVLSHTIVQRLNGLQNLSPQLQSPNLALKNSIITLIGNLSRPPQLHRTLGKLTVLDILIQRDLQVYFIVYVEKKTNISYARADQNECKESSKTRQRQILSVYMQDLTITMKLGGTTALLH